MKHDNDNEPITFISMFSGIEAASVAFKPLGWKALAFAEIEKFPSAVLAHRHPGVPNVGDMTQHDWSQYHGQVDVVCGGPPCQAFSVAGLRNSMDDARGNLSLQYMKALHAISPRNAIVENVPGWLNTKDNAFGCFLAGLVGADNALPPPTGTKWPRVGMVAGPKGRAAWGILDAQHFGLAQRRKRVIVIADFGNGADPVKVLFERKSMSGYSPARRKAREDVAHSIAPSLTASGRGVERIGDTIGQDPVVATLVQKWPAETAPTLNAHFGDKMGLEDQHALNGAGLFVPAETFTKQSIGEYSNLGVASTDSARDYKDSTDLVVTGVTGETSHALTSEGADASEDGTWRGTPVVCVHGTQDPCTSEDTAFAIQQNSGQENVVAWSIMPQNSGKDYKARKVDVAQPLMAGGPVGGNQGGDFIQQPVSVAIRGRDGGATAELGDEVSGAQRASQGGGDKAHVLTSAVRRLTPRECERLQGFPDDYTQIPWRGKPAEQCPDGPRYKALGNSWAVPKFTWLGRRLDKELKKVKA